MQLGENGARQSVHLSRAKADCGIMLQAIGFDPESNLGGLVAGLVVQAHQLVGAEWERRVGLTGVVAELILHCI